MEKRMENTPDTVASRAAKQTLEDIRSRNHYGYLTDLGHLKGYRAVIQALETACETSDSEHVKAEARENLGMYHDEIKRLTAKLKIEAIYAKMHKEELEEAIRETDSHEWIEINSLIGTLNTKITLIQNAL